MTARVVDLGVVRTVRANLARLVGRYPELGGTRGPGNRNDWIGTLKEADTMTEAAETMREATCEGCGGPFQARRKDARFCSAACRIRAHRRRGVTHLSAACSRVVAADAAFWRGIGTDDEPRFRAERVAALVDARDAIAGELVDALRAVKRRRKPL